MVNGQLTAKKWPNSLHKNVHHGPKTTLHVCQENLPPCHPKISLPNYNSAVSQPELTFRNLIHLVTHKSPVIP